MSRYRSSGGGGSRTETISKTEIEKTIENSSKRNPWQGTGHRLDEGLTPTGPFSSVDGRPTGSYTDVYTGETHIYGKDGSERIYDRNNQLVGFKIPGGSIIDQAKAAAAGLSLATIVSTLYEYGGKVNPITGNTFAKDVWEFAKTGVSNLGNWVYDHTIGSWKQQQKAKSRSQTKGSVEKTIEQSSQVSKPGGDPNETAVEMYERDGIRQFENAQRRTILKPLPLPEISVGVTRMTGFEPVSGWADQTFSNYYGSGNLDPSFF